MRRPRFGGPLADAMVELRIFTYTRRALVVACLCLVVVALALVSSHSYAVAQADFFVGQVQAYEQRGITLADALSRPFSVTEVDGNQTIDNPLHYDYVQLSNAAHAIAGANLLGTAIDYAAFLLMPPLFTYLGLWLATYDRHHRTTLLRLSQSRWGSVRLGKLLAVAVLAILVSCAVAILGGAVGLLSHALASELVAQVGFPLLEPTSVSSPLSKIGFAAGVGVFFGVLGLLLGAALRGIAIPLAVVSTALFVVPFAGRWDPRNLLSALAQPVLDFWGQFKVRPPLDVGLGAASLVLLGVAVLLVAGYWVLLSVARSLHRS